MHLSLLNEFIVLAACGSYHEAADRLFTTQSTLSKHIKSIEEELGVILFDRSTRQVKLSEYGKILHPYAIKILEQQQASAAALFAHANRSKRILTVGTMSNLVGYGITDILIQFKQANPGCMLQVIGGAPLSLQQRLSTGECELAFIRHTEMTDLGEFVTIPYDTDRLVAIVSRNHLLANKKSIRLLQLQQDNFVMPPPESFVYQFAVEACRHAGFDPQISMSMHRSDNLIDLVSREAGVFLLTRQTVQTMSLDQVVVLDIEPAYRCTVSLCYRKGEKISAQAQRFLSFVENETVRMAK